MDLQLPGYRITGTIYESANTLVFRGVREAPAASGVPSAPVGASVIVKVPNTEHPSRSQIARWRYEHAMLEGRELPGVIKCYGLETDRGRPALVLEDIGGTSLRRAVTGAALMPGDFLQIAIPLAEALGAVHDAGVVHKDVNPSNVVIDRATGALRLIDFGIASRLPRETQDARHPSQLEGTLHYLSPEQTGRMNRSVDYRTDFYSLGMTFYELLTGRTAFEAGDPLELVHCHIARAPVPPHEIDPSIPRPLSDITAKLLAKTAEHRYQSAFGLVHDLRECERRLREGGAIPAFSIAQRDVSRSLQLPQHLFARDEEIAALLAAFERASQGGAETVLVTGYSGIGKSSVVREIHRSVARLRGSYAAGKSDPYKRDVPYDALAQALGQLVKQVLLEGEAELEAWTARVREALGADAPLVSSVVPELTRLLGAQPPPHELSPAESRARFEGAFCALLRAFAAGRPLVLFLDDLQWVDAASLPILAAIVARSDVGGVLVIGAYRDNEVSPTHPLAITLDAIAKERPAAVTTLTLRPLSRADVRRYVAEALHHDEAAVAPLAELLHDKTGGNPFFLNQLLGKLYEDGLVRFQHAAGAWAWDLAGIAEAPITDNVVDLMIGRIERLSAPARRVVQIAACVGDRFDLASLAAVAGRPAPETAADLWEPLREGLIVPASERYRAPEVYADDDGAEAETRVVAYRFLHDRVHQAAYSMMDDAERTRVHAALGRTLLRTLGAGARDAVLFDVVGHLMAGAARIDDPAERVEVARCALAAARRARASLAYDAAVSFLRFGIGLLPGDAWSAHYRTTADLHLEALRCEYLAGHFDRVDALFDAIVGHAATNVEKAEACRARVVLYENASRFADAVRCGAECLRLFGVELDVEPDDAAVMALIGEVKALVGARPVASLRDLPEATDAETLALAQTLLSLTAPAYFLGPRLFASLIAHMVVLALKKGNTPFSAAGYVFFGVVLASFGDHATGYDFGSLALDLIEKLPNPAIRGKVQFMFGNWLNFRRHHARTDIDHLMEAFGSCVSAGDRTYATYCCTGLVQLWFAVGKNLGEAHAEVPKWIGFVEGVKALDIFDNIRTVDRAFMCLAGMTRGPHTYDDDDGFVESDFERHLNESRSPPVQAYFYHHRSLVRFVLEDFAGALADARESEARQAATSGQFLAEEHPFHQSLILAAAHAEATEAERAEHAVLLERNLARLRVIAAHAPMNYAHKVALVEAEQARLAGEIGRATELYDRAIEAALENGYVHHAAIANECAARFHLARQRTTLARAYLTEAYHGYTTWGATAKVRQLAEKHRRLISDLVVDGARASALSGLTTTGTTLGGTYALDVLSVAKASQAISREIELDRLLGQLVQILLENAGAERGFLLLRRGREWVIEAAGDARGVQVLRSVPIDGGVLPASIVQYVARTGEAVVLDDAASDDAYGRDPYIARAKVKSVVCLPAINTGKVVAIVYLENNLSEAAFTVDRLEVLRLLSTQIAISIDNATLYASLEEKVRARTAELERTQTHLRVLERLETERQMAGGFAHELRNALAGPTALLGEILGLHAEPNVSMPLANARQLEELLALFAPTATREQLGRLKAILRGVLADEERIESMLLVAHGSVSRALTITQSILDYARVGHERAEPSLVDVNAVVGALARELDLELGRQGVRLDARLDPGLARVRGHEAQLHSVLKNLVLNARDASLAVAPGARGAGREHVIVVTTEARDGHARVAVVDRGIGIRAEDLGRVFEPFFSTKPESGTGLGLAVAKKIVSLAGGELTVVSTPGEGTRFDVVLPAVPA